MAASPRPAWDWRPRFIAQRAVPRTLGFQFVTSLPRRLAHAQLAFLEDAPGHRPRESDDHQRPTASQRQPSIGPLRGDSARAMRGILVGRVPVAASARGWLERDPAQGAMIEGISLLGAGTVSIMSGWWRCAECATRSNLCRLCPNWMLLGRRPVREPEWLRRRTRCRCTMP